MVEIAKPRWEDLTRQFFGRDLPDSYLTFDLETTGFSTEEDLPLEFGWCLVVDREIATRGSYLLDWTRLPESVDTDWLTSKLSRLHNIYQDKQMHWQYSYSRLRQEGEHPRWVLEFSHELLSGACAAGLTVVGQNILAFDSAMLATVYGEMLGLDWPVAEDSLFDTGCLEKARQTFCYVDPANILLPAEGESLANFFRRSFNKRAPGIRWGLDACFESYCLADRYGLSASDLHGAEFDSYVCHLLLELNRADNC